MQKYDDTPFRKSASLTARRVWRVVSIVSFLACVVQLFRLVNEIAYWRSEKPRDEMCSAALHNSFPAMTRLYRRGVALDIPCGYARETPVGIAAERGNTGTVQFLLASGADPTIPNRWGQTPLALAQGALARLQQSPENYNLSEEFRYIRILRLLEEAEAAHRARP